jgi:transposase-like protein
MSQNELKQINPNGTGKLDQPDPEVVVPTQRRQFTAADKLRLLDEVDQCDPGQIGAILRREGLYSSHLSQWRRQRATGQLAGLTSQPRGRKAVPQAAELAALRRENERLQAELEQAKLIIEVQKKLCQLFGLPTSQQNESN